MTQYRVCDIYPTIQGEGDLTGMPMILVRLQGCKVGCPWCDTKESWNEEGTFDTVEEIVEQVDLISKGQAVNTRWVLLTGGEPLEQDCDDLIGGLQQAGWEVALETSGTEPLPKVEADWICVSPKEGMPGGKAIVPEACRQANELKFVVGKEVDMTKIDLFLTHYEIPDEVLKCLQPLSMNKKATELCVKECLARGWQLSLQTHQLIGLR